MNPDDISMVHEELRVSNNDNCVNAPAKCSAGSEPRTAALHNLGCKVNAYETEAMQEQLEKAGYRIVPFHETADVYVINTCSVTNIADRKSRQMLHRARKQNPDALIVAAGCYVQTAAEKTHLDVDADLILGNDRKGRLVSALEEIFRNRSRNRDCGVVTDVVPIGESRAYEQLWVSGTGEHTRAFLKVQDGCNQFCSYCIIPYARGRIRSRDPESVYQEVRDLASGSGIREIVLTGIHLSSYGRDQNRTDALAELIRGCSEIPGIERIRLGSLEPGIITEKFISELVRVPKVCPHFHLSLQSGCDSVLRRMNRRYLTSEYREKCSMLRSAFTDPALTTDVIAGFPGETDDEFEQTMEFLRELELYETHIFKYSRREGTVAARMEGHLTEKVKAARSDRLIALGKENRMLFIQRWQGKPCEVLAEEPAVQNGVTGWTGYTKEYIRVFIPSEENGTDLENKMLRGTFTRKNGALPVFGIRSM